MKRARSKKLPAAAVPQSYRGLLHELATGLPDAGSPQAVGALPSQSVSRRTAASEGEALASVLAGIPPPPSGLGRPKQEIQKSQFNSTRLADVLETSGAADAGGQPPAVGQPAGGLAPGTEEFHPTQPAGVLPVTALGGNIRATLNRAAPECAAVLFEHINRLTNLARYAEARHLYAESMEASNLAGRLAIKTIELTVGKQLNIKAEITSQSSIPSWDKLPPEAKDYYKRMSEELAKLPEPDTTIINIPAEPLHTQLDGGSDDPTEIPRSN